MCRITRSPFGPYFSSIDSCLLGAPSSCSSRQSQIYPSRLSTSARPHFTLESGISTRGRSIRTALRMHVSISAMGSVIMFVEVRGPLSLVRRYLPVAHSAATNNGQRTTNSFLPARVADAGDQALVGQLTEANAANAKLAIDGSRPTAQFAAALAARAEFWRLLRFGNLRFASHRGWFLVLSFRLSAFGSQPIKFVAFHSGRQLIADGR